MKFGQLGGVPQPDPYRGLTYNGKKNHLQTGMILWVEAAPKLSTFAVLKYLKVKGSLWVFHCIEAIQIQ